MALKVDISSKLEKYVLDIAFETKASRIGILGESGAGKSMLLKYIAGIYQPAEGKIKLDDDLLLDTNNKVNVIPQNRNIAYMFQNYALFPTMTVRENIEIVVKGDKLTKKEKADSLLKKFHIEDLAGKKPSELSGGEQQRVALARVLAYEPKLILLDEPFSALDENLKERLQIELEKMITDYNGTVIMVSHSKDELYKFSDIDNIVGSSLSDYKPILCDVDAKVKPNGTGYIIEAIPKEVVDRQLVPHTAYLMRIKTELTNNTVSAVAKTDQQMCEWYNSTSYSATKPVNPYTNLTKETIKDYELQYVLGEYQFEDGYNVASPDSQQRMTIVRYPRWFGNNSSPHLLSPRSIIPLVVKSQPFLPKSF